jgi:hypothetical protein
MLDPLPEIGARMQNSLLGMDRNDFVESVLRGVGDGSEEPRHAI